MKAVVALLLLGSAIALAQSVGTFTSSDAANNARRVYNNEFHGGSMFGFSSAFVSGSLNLPTTCPGQNGNTLNNYGYPADCIACPCNVPAQFVTSVCADSSRPFMGHRGCTLAFVGAVGGVAVRCVSTDGTCRLSVQRHGEVNITTSLRCNPSSIGGVTLPTNVTLHVQLISESKFVVSSSGAFMFAGIGERSVRRFNPFFRMRRLKKNQLGHGGPAGGLGGGYGGQGGLDNGNIWLAPGAASVGVSGGDSGAFGSTNSGPFNGGPGGHGNDEFESDDEFMARRDAFITRRFRNFRCPSVAGLINFPDPRSNEQDDDDWGRFDRDDETCIGTGNGLSDFSDFNDNQCDNVGGLGGGHGGNDNGGAFGSDYNHGQGLLNGGNYCGGGQ